MGNIIASSKSNRAQLMNIDGQTTNLKLPIRAHDVTSDYPDHVLLESESVRRYGPLAEPLDPNQNLLPKRLYFLVELPKTSPYQSRSGPMHVSAKERLERLMLAKRSSTSASASPSSSGELGTTMRVKMRLPRKEVERLMRESGDERDAAARILELYVNNGCGGAAGVMKSPAHKKRVSFPGLDAAEKPNRS